LLGLLGLRRLAILLLLLGVFAPLAPLAPAREIVYVVGKDGRITSLEASNLSPISSSVDFGHPDSITTLTTGNALLVTNTTAEVTIVTPNLERVSSHKYPELKSVVNASGLYEGLFIIADKTQLLVSDEKQSKIIALRDFSKVPTKPNQERTIRRVVTRGSVWGQHIAALCDIKSSPNDDPKPGVWFGKVDTKTGAFNPTDYKEDLPGCTAAIPFVNGMWLVVGGGEMSIRGWGLGFPKRIVQEKVPEIAEGAAIPNKQFAMLNSKGELSVWKYTNDAFICMIGPTAEYGKLTALQTTDAGDIVVGTADGRLTLLHLALPQTRPAATAPILAETNPSEPPAAAATQASATVPPPVSRPSLQVMAQKGDLGSLIGLSIGKTP
jgi:hypothetical protein